MLSNRNLGLLLTPSFAIIWLHPIAAQAANYIQRDFVIDAAIFSYMPDNGIEEYKTHGSGMTEARAKLGLGTRIDDIPVSVAIAPRIEVGRFLVSVDVEPEEAKRLLKFEKQKLDVTQLKPTAIRLGVAKDGRIYQLNLSPSVRVTDNTPRPLEVSELRLHNWRFPDSPILVNDALYVGRLSCAQSPVAYVDISGVARVEFSLYRLKDAKPWGVLSRGVVTLTNPEDQTTIQVSNVHNGGPHAVELPGGPYRVWVRWSAPTLTVEQHRDELAEFRKRILAGEFPDANAAYIDKQLARDPSPWVHSSGIRGLHKGELVESPE